MIPKEIIRKVRQIEIKTQNVVNSILSGEYHSAFKGQGMEFSEVRSYVEGDDVRTIDWNVTARTGEPHVKKFIEERELTVMFLVDASASGDFGSDEKFKSEIAVELCALLAFSAIKNNDRVGLVIFTSEIEKFVPPKKGKNHVLRVIRELLYFKPHKRGTQIGEALKFLNRVQKKSAVVFVVSDFLDRNYESPFRIASKKHDLIAVTLSDPREKHFSESGLIEVEDPETGEVILIDSGSRQFRARYAESFGKREREVHAFLRSVGIDEIPVSTHEDYVEPLVKFFKKREKIMA
ncbi:MAG: DUF58 domain-containing protein [Chitinivibrionales bacterium]|nr:DUF58 domain-containing protein [Chitinivibrionales bacterium]